MFFRIRIDFVGVCRLLSVLVMQVRVVRLLLISVFLMCCLCLLRCCIGSLWLILVSKWLIEVREVSCFCCLWGVFSGDRLSLVVIGLWIVGRLWWWKVLSNIEMLEKLISGCGEVVCRCFQFRFGSNWLQLQLLCRYQIVVMFGMLKVLCRFFRCCLIVLVRQWQWVLMWWLRWQFMLCIFSCCRVVFSMLVVMVEVGVISVIWLLMGCQVWLEEG